MQAAESGKRHRRRPGRRRTTRDGGTPKRAVRAELVCLPPRASGLTTRPSPSRGEGRPREQVIVSMILRVIQRDQRSRTRADVSEDSLPRQHENTNRSSQTVKAKAHRAARCVLHPEFFFGSRSGPWDLVAVQVFAGVPGMECCGVWRSSQCHAAGPWNINARGKCCGFSEWLALHERRFSCAVLMCASTRAQEYGKVDL